MGSSNHWLVNYYHGRRTIYQDEWGMPEVQIGQGIILEDPAHPETSRWRVVDIWHSYDKRGHFDIGAHVFLEPVVDHEDDLPKRLAPDYFIDPSRD